MGYLYVTESDAQIGVTDRYVTVKNRDGSLTKIPIETLALEEGDAEIYHPVWIR